MVHNSSRSVEVCIVIEGQTHSATAAATTSTHSQCSNNQSLTCRVLKKVSKIMGPDLNLATEKRSPEALAAKPGIERKISNISIHNEFNKACEEEHHDTRTSGVRERKISNIHAKNLDDHGHAHPHSNSDDHSHPHNEIRERKISSTHHKFWDEDFPGKQDHLHNIGGGSEKKPHFPETVCDLGIDLHKSVPHKSKLVTRKSTQILASVAANMGAFALGAVLAWSSTALPSMRKSGDFEDLDKSQEAWIGSIVTLGALASCPAAAYAMVTFGRRKSMMFLTLPFLIGWGLIAFANELPSIGHPIYTIYVGRVLTGFCGGAFAVLAPVFVAETSHEKVRGGCASLFDLLASFGMLYIYVIGAYTSWQVQALACALIPLGFHALAMLVPESPRFLVEQGKLDEAGKALSWLYGIKGEQLSMELGVLKKSVEESQAKPVNFDRVILKMSVLKPILICVSIMFFYTMSAYDAVIFYTVDIFKSTGTSIDPKDSTIILGAVQVLATIPAAFIVDKCGRRLLLMISEIFMFVSLVGMGCFFFLTRGDDEDKTLHLQYGWLPLTALNVFLIAYSVGIGPLSMILLGEVVPSHIKGLTSCTALMVRWALGFGVTNLFETLEDSIGIDRTYWLFATICGIGAIFVYYCIPETKGRSLDDIQIGFMHPTKLKALQATAIMNNNMDALHNKDNLHHHDQKG